MSFLKFTDHSAKCSTKYLQISLKQTIKAMKLVSISSLRLMASKNQLFWFKPMNWIEV